MSINQVNDCPWCLDENDDEWSDKLCRAHAAEHEGATETWLDKRDATQDAEYDDWAREEQAAYDDEWYHGRMA